MTHPEVFATFNDKMRNCFHESINLLPTKKGEREGTLCPTINASKAY